jgi:hypothetical protein
MLSVVLVYADWVSLRMLSVIMRVMSMVHVYAVWESMYKLSVVYVYAVYRYLCVQYMLSLVHANASCLCTYV